MFPGMFTQNKKGFYDQTLNVQSTQLILVIYASKYLFFIALVQLR